MKRYVVIGATVYSPDFWENGMTADQVIEKEPQTRKAGLLDASGRDIFSIEETGPVGFIRLNERKER